MTGYFEFIIVFLYQIDHIFRRKKTTFVTYTQDKPPSNIAVLEAAGDRWYN